MSNQAMKCGVTWRGYKPNTSKDKPGLRGQIIRELLVGVAVAQADTARLADVIE
jgi:hypothetical protein